MSSQLSLIGETGFRAGELAMLQDFAIPVFPSDVKCFVEEADLNTSVRVEPSFIALLKVYYFSSLTFILSTLNMCVISPCRDVWLGQVFLSKTGCDRKRHTCISALCFLKTTGLFGFSKICISEVCLLVSGSC